MKHEEKIKVGISIGDLNGVGGEIILKTFEDSRMLEICTPVIFASGKLMTFLKKHFNLEFNFHGVDDASDVLDGKINVVNVWKESVEINFGAEEKISGKYAFQSLQAVTKAILQDQVDVMVTAPIHKNNIQSADFNFPGHTDYLAKELQGKSLMFMVSETLKVGLLTDHVAVKDVASKITPELIEEKINIIENSLKQDFQITKPKIAVLGINPHNGDNGVIGKEDDEVMKPTLAKLLDKGKMVFGPYAADSFFGSENYKNFDAVIAAYHDQGLVPFKTISFGHGVNFTAGLKKVRTSPDHGTAFDIAGKGTANHHSFSDAVFAAIDIYKRRNEYLKLKADQLKKVHTKKM